MSETNQVFKPYTSQTFNNISGNTVLLDIHEIDLDRIVCAPVARKEVPQAPDSKAAKITYKSISVGYLLPNGKIGELAIPTLDCFSFGVQPSINSNTGLTDGYTISLALLTKNSPQPEEIAWYDKFMAILKRFSDYLQAENIMVEELGIRTQQRVVLSGMMTKFNPIYYGKGADGEPLTSDDRLDSASLSVKCLYNKKTGVINTLFYDDQDQMLNPLILEGKMGRAKAVIKLESIYYGSGKLRLQIKANEVEYKLTSNAVRRLLPSSSSRAPPAAESQIPMHSATVIFEDDVVQGKLPSVDVDNDPLTDSDDEAPPVSSTSPEPVPVAPSKAPAKSGKKK